MFPDAISSFVDFVNKDTDPAQHSDEQRICEIFEFYLYRDNLYAFDPYSDMLFAYDCAQEQWKEVDEEDIPGFADCEFKESDPWEWADERKNEGISILRVFRLR